MGCEEYRKAISEAAAAEVPAKLREHLQGCAMCSAVFAEESDLYRAMDAGIARMVNVETPASLAAGVRGRLSEAPVEAGRRRWIWALGGAVAVAAVMLVATSGVWRGPAEAPPLVNENKMAQMTPPAVERREEPQKTNAAARKFPPAPLRMVRRAKSEPTEVAGAVVLIPKGRRQATDQLIRMLRNDQREMGEWLVAKENNRGPLEIAPIEIAPLGVPSSGGGSGRSR